MQNPSSKQDSIATNNELSPVSSAGPTHGYGLSSRVGHPVAAELSERPQGLEDVRAPGPGAPVSLAPVFEATNPLAGIDVMEYDGPRGPEEHMERVEVSGPAPLDLPPQSTRSTPIEQSQGIDTHTSTNTQPPQNLDTSHILAPVCFNVLVYFSD